MNLLEIIKSKKFKKGKNIHSIVKSFLNHYNLTKNKILTKEEVLRFSLHLNEIKESEYATKNMPENNNSPKAQGSLNTNLSL